MCLEGRSMSADTSGAGCQGKLCYPATSTPLPPTHRQNTHTHTLSQRVMSNLSLDPEGGQRTGEEGDDEDIDARSESLRKLARAGSICASFSFVCKINCVKLTKNEQETCPCTISKSGLWSDGRVFKHFLF